MGKFHIEDIVATTAFGVLPYKSDESVSALLLVSNSFFMALAFIVIWAQDVHVSLLDGVSFTGVML